MINDLLGQSLNPGAAATISTGIVGVVNLLPAEGGAWFHIDRTRILNFGQR